MPPERRVSSKSRRSSRPARLPVFLTERERDLVLEAARRSAPRGVRAGAARDSAVIAIGVYAGLRVAEISALDRADVDLEDLAVLVRQGKGGKDRVVPLNIAAAIAVEEYLATRDDEDPALFVSRKGGRLSVRAIQRMVRRVAGDAELAKRVTPHKLRHTFATLLIENDADVFTVQELLGHASVATTQIYVHVSRARKRGAVDRL